MNKRKVGGLLGIVTGIIVASMSLNKLDSTNSKIDEYRETYAAPYDLEDYPKMIKESDRASGTLFGGIVLSTLGGIAFAAPRRKRKIFYEAA